MAKTTTAVNLGIGLAQAGRAVLLVDVDPQGSLTSSLGFYPDEMNITTATLIQKAARDEPIAPNEGVIQHKEGVDLIPSNIDLSGLERELWQEFSPYGMLAEVLEPLLDQYLTYLVVVKGRSPLTADEYRIDNNMLFEYLLRRRGTHLEKSATRNFACVDIDFIKSITVAELYDLS